MPHATKSVKVLPEHHRQLKLKGVEHGCSLQQYLAFVLELAFSEDPVLKQARDAYFHQIGEHGETLLQTIKRITPRGAE